MMDQKLLQDKHFAGRFGYLAIMAVFFAGYLLGQQAAPAADLSLLSNIQTRMQEHVASGDFSGIVTLVAQGGKVIQTTAAGKQDIENNLPMRTDSIFQLMSMTKPITAVGLMILVDEGRLSLSDEVLKYLPEFRDQKLNVNGVLKTPTRPVRIYDLLTHTSGMRGMPQGSMKDIHHLLDHSLAEAVREYAQEPLEFEPGTRLLYSNLGMATAGRIIEVVSGMPYESFIQKRILDPLQMKDTFYYPPVDKLNRIAIVYEHKSGKLVSASAETQGGNPRLFKKDARYPGPEFGLFSTAEDLEHFYQMMLNDGRWEDKRILSPAAVLTMTEVLTGAVSAERSTDFGLGWEIVSKPTATLSMIPIGSYGHGGLFGTRGWVIPKRNMVTVFLVACNGEGCEATAQNEFQQMVAASISR